MSAALELVKIALQAYGGGDAEITMQLSGPLIRWDERASRPDGELVWGQEEVLRAMRRYLSSWEEYDFEVEKIAEIAPGRVVGVCRERGRDGADVPVDRRYCGLWLVEEGRIACWTTYLTSKEAISAARDWHPGSERAPERGPAQEPVGAASRNGSLGAFSEEQRRAAKRRAALARAAREGGRRAPTV